MLVLKVMCIYTYYKLASIKIYIIYQVPSIFRGNVYLNKHEAFHIRKLSYLKQLTQHFFHKFFHKALKQVWRTVILDYDENPLNILNSLTMINNNKAINYFKCVIIKNDLLLSITLRAIDMNGVFCLILNTTLQYV